MIDDPNTPPGDNSDSPAWEADIKNVKGEFNRKHGETKELLNQLLTTQAQLQEALTRMSTPKQAPPPAEETNLDELLYSDPKKYAAIIKQQATKEAVEAVRQENSSQASIRHTVDALYAEYPELADLESPLTKASREIIGSMPENDRNNARSYEYAVMKAAQALEVQPRSKRKQAEDDFVAPSYTSPQGRSKKRTNEQVINANRDVASAMGVNLDDPKTKERYINLLKSKGSI